MDCSRNEACKNKSIMFLDFALFQYKTGQKIPVLCWQTEIWFLLWGSGKQEVGPLLVVYFGCQNGDTENIGILLKVVFFEVQ